MVAAKTQRDLIHGVQLFPEPRSYSLRRLNIQLHSVSLSPAKAVSPCTLPPGPCGVQGEHEKPRKQL